MNITKSNITEVIPNSNANCGNTNIPQTVKLIDRILTADCHYNNSPFFCEIKSEYPSTIIQP